MLAPILVSLFCITSTVLAAPQSYPIRKSPLEARADAQTVCVSKVKNPVPKGATCNKPGHLKNSISYYSPGASITRQYCYTLCLNDPRCKAIAHFADISVCNIYLYTLKAQGYTTAQPNGALFSDRACFQGTKFGDAVPVRNGDFERGQLEPYWSLDNSTDGYSASYVELGTPQGGGTVPGGTTAAKVTVLNVGPNSPGQFLVTQFTPCLGLKYILQFDYLRVRGSKEDGCLAVYNDGDYYYNGCWTGNAADDIQGKVPGEWAHVSVQYAPKSAPSITGLLLVAGANAKQMMWLDNVTMTPIKW